MKKLLSKLGSFGRIIAVIFVLAVMQLVYAGFLIAATPDVIRNPKLEHYHFRMQIIVDGKAEDFSKDKYQAELIKDACSADLPDRPIHFHDNKDQMVHIHWEGMTGGLVMKNYGWNFIGGTDGSLGFRMSKITQPRNITIHSQSLPEVSKQTKYYVYIGDKDSYKEKSFEDWKKQDLEEFFGVTSNSPAHKINKGEQSSLWNKLFPKASAHGAVDDGHASDGTETEEQKLTRINNLIGNVVIFAQQDPPSDQQVKERFNDLEPLSDSTCGG